MSMKRRDSKKMILRDGEIRCKDGKYRFTYSEHGKQKCFYSWKLEKTDPLPQGKRECIALMEKEDELRITQYKRIAYHAEGMTVLDLVKRYTMQKRGVKHTIKTGYQSYSIIE